MAGVSPAPEFRLAKMTFPAELSRSQRPPSPAPEFQLGKMTYSLIGTVPEGDGDLGDPRDRYKVQLTYTDGTIDYGTVRVDRTNPSTLDVYDSHQFKTPGTRTVQVLLKEGGEPVSGGSGMGGNGGFGGGNGGYGTDYGVDTNYTANVVVRYPSVADIEADPGVIKAAKKLWQDVLQVSQKDHTVVEEMGAWIELNTETGKYQFVDWTTGHPTTSDLSSVTPGINAPPKPLDTYDQIYVVAAFHTHVPVKFATPKGYGTPVGPSGDDTSNANGRNLPTLVYDYVGKDLQPVSGPPFRGVVVGETPLNAEATLWHTGPDRRPTPP